MIRFWLIIATLTTSLISGAQEFRCEVEVNADAIENSSKEVFELLKQEISSYMNDYVWTLDRFSPAERLECRIFITLEEYSGDTFKGDWQIQLSRPVYNSDYSTPLLNHKEEGIEWIFRQGESLQHTDFATDSQLTALLDFYALLMLGMDYDSFSPGGGEIYYVKADEIARRAQSAGLKGWRMFDDDRSRTALLNALRNEPKGAFSDLLYSYHRDGMDMMATSADKGRSNITGALKHLEKIFHRNPMGMGLNVFRDAKLDELIGIYSQAPESERKEVFNLLVQIYPLYERKLGKIKNPENQNR